MKTEFLACLAAGLLVHVGATAQTMAPADDGTTMATDPNAQVPPAPVPPAGEMIPAAPGTTPDPAAPVGSPANPAVVGGNMTPPPPASAMKDYPLCSRSVQDSCINPGEARKMKKRK